LRWALRFASPQCILHQVAGLAGYQRKRPHRRHPVYRIFLTNMGYYPDAEYTTFDDAVNFAKRVCLECAIVHGSGDERQIIAMWSALRGLAVVVRCSVCGQPGPVVKDEEFPENLLCADCNDARMP